MNSYINNKIKYKFFNKNWGISRVDQKLKQEQLDNITRNLGAEAKNLIVLSQVHSSDVVLVNEPFHGELPRADALITQTPGLFIGVLTADCAPILLASSDAQIVAAVHAGWRGAVAGILENTISKMHGLGATDLVALVGPCIWQESYEVGDDFYDQIAEKSFFMKNKNSGRYYFDLPAYVTHKLQKAGVRYVEPSMANTYSDNNFNSYRRTTHHPEYELRSNISVIGIVGD